MMVAYITALRNILHLGALLKIPDPQQETRSFMLTILIVDDQPSVLDALRQCFALEPDIRIVGNASDGQEALARARELHPDIVVTDIKMPIMDGLEVTTALREVSPETRVVILSIYDGSVNREQAKAAGAAEFVGKHDRAEDLLAAIRRAGAR
jgi:DNA-binding NarL/FixJ family response regulator